jgi:hypothetical protein
MLLVEIYESYVSWELFQIYGLQPRTVQIRSALIVGDYSQGYATK